MAPNTTTITSSPLSGAPTQTKKPSLFGGSSQQSFSKSSTKSSFSSCSGATKSSSPWGSTFKSQQHFKSLHMF